MAVQNLTAEMWAGNRRVFAFTVTETSDAGSAAQDLTGYTVTFALANFDRNGNPVKSNPLIDLSSAGAQVVITDAAAGEVEVELLEADTIALRTPVDYYFELEVVDGSGNSDVAATGTLTIHTNVENA